MQSGSIHGVLYHTPTWAEKAPMTPQRLCADLATGTVRKLFVVLPTHLCYLYLMDVCLCEKGNDPAIETRISDNADRCEIEETIRAFLYPRLYGWVVTKMEND